MPDGVCPSLRTDQSTVRWLLRGVVARQMRSDYNVVQELNVYTAPGDETEGEAEVQPPSDPLADFQDSPGGG